MEKNMENASKIVKSISERAEDSGFGNPDKLLIEDLYGAVKELAKMPVSEKPLNPLLWVRSRTEKLLTARLGSGILFNLQGLLEQPDLAEGERKVIQKIFLSVDDERDLHFRWGPCSSTE